MRRADGLEERLVEGMVRAFQNQRRLTEEGDQPPRGNGDGRGQSLIATASDEIRHEGSGIGSSQGRIGGAQMAQPSESVERIRPFR